MVSADTAGIDDKSFEQSACGKGMQEVGQNILQNFQKRTSKGSRVYSNQMKHLDYTSNIDQAISSQFKTIFGIGYLLKYSSRYSGRQQKREFHVLIDDTVNGAQTTSLLQHLEIMNLRI